MEEAGPTYEAGEAPGPHCWQPGLASARAPAAAANCLGSRLLPRCPCCQSRAALPGAPSPSPLPCPLPLPPCSQGRRRRRRRGARRAHGQGPGGQGGAWARLLGAGASVRLLLVLASTAAQRCWASTCPASCCAGLLLAPPPPSSAPQVRDFAVQAQEGGMEAGRQSYEAGAGGAPGAAGTGGRACSGRAPGGMGVPPEEGAAASGLGGGGAAATACMPAAALAAARSWPGPWRSTPSRRLHTSLPWPLPAGASSAEPTIEPESKAEMAQAGEAAQRRP